MTASEALKSERNFRTSSMNDQSDRPRLSVVMSVYNGQSYLSDAIDSVLKQSFDKFEFIIINDGSTDSSGQILRSYAKRDARIRLVEQENAGLTISLTRGLDLAKGEFIARMDADDYSEKERFDKQLTMFDDDPSLVAVTGNVEHFYEDGRDSYVASINIDMRLVPLLLVFSNVIGGHGQMMYRRSAYFQAGGYDPAYNNCEDYELWTRLIRVGPFGNVPSVLYRYRAGT